MGIEMTLLRALAFHPRMPFAGPETPRQSFARDYNAAVMTPPRSAATRRLRPRREHRQRRCRHLPVRCWRRAISSAGSSKTKK